MDEYLVPETLNIARINCKEAFDQLAENDKHYAFCFYKASWAGAGIVAEQVSEESKDLLKIAKDLFSKPDSFEKLKNEDQEQVKHFLQYWAYLCGNLGNYASWGDKKFVPRIKPDEMVRLVQILTDNSQTLQLFNNRVDKIYSLENNEKILGFPPNNTSHYFSNNLTEEEIKKVTKFMESINMEGWNTRLYKLDGPQPLYMILVASSSVKPEMHVNKIYDFEGISVSVSCMDHSDELTNIVKWLETAKQYANPVQRDMLESYVKHFTYGNIEDHKESQRHWIQDKGPNVETNIGFIENYRDPEGVRAEFEGLVAVVNKEQSKKYTELVNHAEEFIADLPWDPLFEKEKFTKPDYTSLDVLGFCTSGPPIGINIPNYDDVRQKLGFKNVTLGNIINALQDSYGGRPEFVPEQDVELYKKHVSSALSIGVATHELLGHGSGALLYENSVDKTKLNEFLKNNQEFSYSTYKEGETWSSKFKRLASSYEECRAESCALYFACNPKIASIFGVSDEDFLDNLYVGWLNMMVSAVKGTDNYNVEKNEWMQAHSQARFVIMKVLKEANFVDVVFIDDSMVIVMDKTKILTEGKQIIGNFLRKMQFYKSTGNVEDGSKFYHKYSVLDNIDMKMLELYKKTKKPRAVLVQPNLKVNDNAEYTYVDYEPTCEGVLKSFCDRF